MGWFIFSVVSLIVSVGWFAYRVGVDKESVLDIILFVFTCIFIITLIMSSVNGLYEKSGTVNNIEYRMEGSKINNIYFRMVKVNTQDTILYNPNTKHVIELNKHAPEVRN